MSDNSIKLPKSFEFSNLRLSTLRQHVENSNSTKTNQENSQENSQENKQENNQENSQEKIVNNPNAIKIGDRLELFVDDALIRNMSNLRRQVHQPTAKEISIVFDEPWEGNVSAYYTLIQESDQFMRLYYRGGDININKMRMGIKEGMMNGQRVCYAESHDGGDHWIKPYLGLFKYRDRSGNVDPEKKNNIIWDDIRGTENFTPFKDTNPNCKPDEKYKAVGSRLNPYQLFGFTSPDGIHWKIMMEGKPLLTLYHGKFDTQNVAFWNEKTNQYMLFYRDCINRRTNLGRGIRVCVSQDFIHWGKFAWLKYADPLHQQNYQLYTNGIQKYYRAPHYLIGFPNRFNQPRQAIPGHPQSGVFDAIFMSSRDGYNWKRTSEAIFRPGPQRNRWATRNNQIALGMYETPSDFNHLYDKPPNEISILSCEGYYLHKCSLRRYTWRLDGFVSIRASLSGGELITKPLIFSGQHLVLNLSTSALGWAKVEIQDGSTDQPIPGFEMNNCFECFGDSVNKRVVWNHNDQNTKLSELIGRSIRLKFRLKDCDLYSYQFVN